MRVAFAAIFAAALLVVPFSSGAEPTPMPLLLPPRVIIPVHPIQAPLGCAAAMAKGLTLCSPGQSPAFKPTALSNFVLSSSSGSAGKACSQKTSTTITLAAPSVATQGLEQACLTGRSIKELDVFQPPSTMNVFRNVFITSFTENAGANSATEVFSFVYGSILFKTTTANTTTPVDSWNAL